MTRVFGYLMAWEAVAPEVYDKYQDTNAVHLINRLFAQWTQE